MASIGKGRQMNPVPAGKVLGREKANNLIAFFNAFMKSTVIAGANNDILIGDKILFQLANGGGSGGGGGGGGGTIAPFKITDSFSALQDWFTGFEMNSDGTFNETTIYIAKQRKFRPSIVVETIGGIGITYSYSDNFNRSSSFTSGGTLYSQTEQLFPLPVTNDIVFCGQLPFPEPNILSEEEVSATWVDLTPRVWARKRGQ